LTDPTSFFLSFQRYPVTDGHALGLKNNIKDNKGHIFKFISPPCQFIV
jgi:hypothetical protein